MKFEDNYIIGLDLGIASVGWSAIEIDKQDHPIGIIDTGVVIVESMEDKDGNLQNAERRGYRGSRRTLNRRNERVRRVKGLIRSNFPNLDFDTLFNINQTSIYELKVKGLNGELSSEELAKVLVHYAKHRGFKSNRKEDKASDDGKILEAIEKNKDRLNSMYISELLFSEIDGVNKIKNSIDGDYKYSFLREDYEKEINKLLDTQIKYNVINSGFKYKYIEIWSSQRDFSEGPGGDSPYKVDFASVFGYSKLDPENYRAPKDSISQQYNTGLLKLVNLRYRNIGDRLYNKRLTVSQINNLLNKANSSTKLIYADVVKEINDVKLLEFKNLDLSKSGFIKLVSKYKEKNNIDIKDSIDFKDEAFIEYKIKELNKQEVFKLTTNNELRKQFKKLVGIDYYDNLPIEYKDDIVTCLTFYKTDDRIKQYFSGILTEKTKVVSDLDWNLYPEFINDVVPFLTLNVSESSALSLNLLRKLNKEILKGYKCTDEDDLLFGEYIPYNYDEAMSNLGINHAKVEKVVTKVRKIDNIKRILEEQYPNEISNPRVIRVLSRTMSVINALIDRYGMPKYIHLEIARDINLKQGKREILYKEQLNNLSINEEIKAQILTNHPEKTYSKISRYDIEKYKLYREQNGRCAYSLKPISEGELLTNKYEIDHIIPYSLCNINTFVNKTLVSTKANQDKTNNIPVDYFKNNGNINEFVSFIENNSNMSKRKKQLYLLNSIDELNNEFSEGALGDTRFITKYLVEILTNNLAFNNEDIKIPVVSHKAGYVNYFKRANKITYLTHSLENPDYKAQNRVIINNLEYSKSKEIISFTLNTTDEISKKNYSSTIKYQKENANTPFYIKKRNENITTIYENLHNIDVDIVAMGELTPCKDNNYRTILDNLLDYDINESTKDAFIELISDLKSEIDKQIIKKNRDNHLHHALDAISVGCLTRSVQQQISNYDKKRYEILDSISRNGYASIDLKNKSIIAKSPDEFKKYEDEFLSDVIPMPYPNFKNEVIAYVYERDNEVQKHLIPNKDIRVLNPVITKKKRYDIVNGKMIFRGLHKETVLGRTGDIITKKISAKALKAKDCEKIIGKETYAKHTYEACKEWIESNKPTDYPILENGREIKKIKTEVSTPDKVYYLGDERGGYAMGENVVRIELYEKKGEDRIYYVQRNAMNLSQEQEGKLDKLTLWYSRSAPIIVKFNDKYSLKDFQKEYDLITFLHPGDLVEIIKNKDKNGITQKGKGYVVGFSDGKIEVCSIIGDNYDLKYNFNTTSDRLFITISTINSIRKINQNILGYIKE